MRARARWTWGLVASVAMLAGCSDPGDSVPSSPSPRPLRGASGSPSAAGAGSGAESADPLLGFDEDVHPILVASCGDSGCHDVETVATPGHGAPDADQAFAAVQGMSKGEPVYRRILARASGQDPDGFMPPPYAGCEGPLGTGECLELIELERIRSWVEQGATRR